MPVTRSVVRWFWLPVAFALAWSAWILYSRRAENAAIEKAAEQKEAEADRRILDQLGGSELKILTFYANPPVVRKGERGLLCYGVSNAKEVRIEPNVEGAGPALSRCLEIHPAHDTEYKLSARNQQGGEVTQSVQVRVR